MLSLTPEGGGNIVCTKITKIKLKSEIPVHKLGRPRLFPWWMALLAIQTEETG